MGIISDETDFFAPCISCADKYVLGLGMSNKKPVTL